MVLFRRLARHAGACLALSLAVTSAVAPSSAAASTTETYTMAGYEVFYAPDQAVFVGTGAGVDGPHELSGWYTSVYHTLSVSPGNVTGGSAALQRIDGIRISGTFSGGDVAQTDPGYNCTTETHQVSAQLVDVARSDRPAELGTAVLTATLTHYHAWVFGTCYAYSARIDGTISVSV